MPGVTAYVGLLDLGKPEPGQTVVVSGAAGAVGGVVGQIAKLKGCRAVGIAGGPDKCRFVVEQLGFDACLDYKAGDLREQLKAATPQGVDVYFDNVGGEILDTVLPRMNPFSRLPLCGLISQYNATEAYGVKNFRYILVNRIKVQGFIVFDFAERYAAARADLAQWLAEGKLRHHETVAEGLRAAPGRLPRHAARREPRQAAGEAGLSPAATTQTRRRAPRPIDPAGKDSRHFA